MECSEGVDASECSSNVERCERVTDGGCKKGNVGVEGCPAQVKGAAKLSLRPAAGCVELEGSCLAGVLMGNGPMLAAVHRARMARLLYMYMEQLRCMRVASQADRCASTKPSGIEQTERL
jgi:hypothetical protein